MLDGNVCGLELGSGSGTVAEAWGNLGFDMTTVDSDPERLADLCCRWEELDPAEWKHIDVVWISFDCKVYSVMSFPRGHFKEGVVNTAEARRAEESNQAALAFIEAIKPRFFVIENPRALLRTRPWMKKFDRFTVSYCQYREGSMKPTDLFGVLPVTWEPKMCRNGAPCHTPAPRGSRTGTQGPQTAAERAIVPYELALDIGRHMWSEYHGGHLFCT